MSLSIDIVGIVCANLTDGGLCLFGRSRHSIFIWYLYIQLEVRHGNAMKGKALFFRAIRECPWSKGMFFYFPMETYCR